MRLRPYQAEAISRIHAAWDGVGRGTGAGRKRSVAAVLPTGAGKTVIFTHPDFWGARLADGGRMLVLVHRDELAAQTMGKLQAMPHDLTVGRVQAEHNQVDARLLVGSVQTLANPRRLEQLSDVRLIVVDEAHHATAPTYRRVLDNFPDAVVAGFSATLARADESKLGDVWEELVYRLDVLDGVKGGWLVDVRGKTITTDTALDDVSRSRGDYTEGGLGTALMAAGAHRVAAKAYLEHASGRQGVGFWPTVQFAEEAAIAFDDAGISSRLITGETPIEERQAAYAAVRDGTVQTLHSCMVLTEGFDLPQLDCAIIGRPTSNASLYVQMVGRVLRPWPHERPRYGRKNDALVLDVAGIGGRLRLATLADLSETTLAVAEGESVAEAAEREVAERDVELMAAAAPVGRVAAADFDLFQAAQHQWLQTRGRGTWFTKVGDVVVFLWPRADGLWTVGRLDKGKRLRGAVMLLDNLTFDWAMSRADGIAATIAVEQGLRYGMGRDASWRGVSRPTEAQLSYAAALGIDTAGMGRGEVSDAINIVSVSRRLDTL